MINVIFACANTLAVGFNFGIIIGGGKYDPISSAIIIIVCGSVAVYELAKVRRDILSAGQTEKAR